MSTDSFELKTLLLYLSRFVSIMTKNKQMSRKINQRKKRISPVWRINTISNVNISQSSFEISRRQNWIPLQFYLLAYFLHTWEQALPLTLVYLIIIFDEISDKRHILIFVLMLHFVLFSFGRVYKRLFCVRTMRYVIWRNKWKCSTISPRASSI